MLCGVTFSLARIARGTGGPGTESRPVGLVELVEIRVLRDAQQLPGYGQNPGMKPPSPAGLLRNSEDLDTDAPYLQPDLAEPDYDDAAFAETLTDYDETGEEPW